MKRQSPLIILFTLFATCLTCHPQNFHTEDFLQSRLSNVDNLQGSSSHLDSSYLKGDSDSRTAGSFSHGAHIHNRERQSYRSKAINKAFIHNNPEQHVHNYGPVHHHYYYNGQRQLTLLESRQKGLPAPVIQPVQSTSIATTTNPTSQYQQTYERAYPYQIVVREISNPPTKGDQRHRQKSQGTHVFHNSRPTLQEGVNSQFFSQVLKQNYEQK